MASSGPWLAAPKAVWLVLGQRVRPGARCLASAMSTLALTIQLTAMTERRSGGGLHQDRSAVVQRDQDGSARIAVGAATIAFASTSLCNAGLVWASERTNLMNFM